MTLAETIIDLRGDGSEEANGSSHSPSDAGRLALVRDLRYQCSIADTSISDNNEVTGQSEANNSSASAIITITTTSAPLADEQFSQRIWRGWKKMARINSSRFGSITIDGVTYNHDVYIHPSGKVEERKYGHTFTREQAEHVLEENPDTVVIGKGTSGLASLSSDASDLLRKNGVEITEDYTQNMVDEFNKLSETKRVAAIIHVTC